MRMKGVMNEEAAGDLAEVEVSLIEFRVIKLCGWSVCAAAAMAILLLEAVATTSRALTDKIIRNYNVHTPLHYLLVRFGIVNSLLSGG